MAEDLRLDEIPGLSDWELVSRYLNRSYGDDPRLEEGLRQELLARRLPLPVQAAREPEAPKAQAMAPETFLSYVLLIYTVSGLVYSWLYLPERILRGDFQRDRKHHLIQTGIALAYQAAEVAALVTLGEQL